MASQLFNYGIQSLADAIKQNRNQDKEFQAALANIVARNPQIAPYVSGSKNWSDFVEKLKGYDPIKYQVQEQTALNAIPKPVTPITPQDIGKNFFDTWKEGAFNQNPSTSGFAPDQLSSLKQQFPGLFQQTDVLQGTSPLTEILPQNPFIQKIASGLGLGNVQLPVYQQQDTIVPNPSAQASIGSKTAYSDLNTINAKLKPFNVAFQATDRGYEPTIIPGAESMPSGQSPAYQLDVKESEKKMELTDAQIEKYYSDIAKNKVWMETQIKKANSDSTSNPKASTEYNAYIHGMNHRYNQTTKKWSYEDNNGNQAMGYDEWKQAHGYSTGNIKNVNSYQEAYDLVKKTFPNLTDAEIKARIKQKK